MKSFLIVLFAASLLLGITGCAQENAPARSPKHERVVLLPPPAHNKYWLPDAERQRLIREGDKYNPDACMRLYYYYEFSRMDHDRALMWLRMAMQSDSKEAKRMMHEIEKKQRMQGKPQPPKPHYR